jgi:hypothetical protein
MVRAEKNEPDSLLAALKASAFYASTGPEIHDNRWGDDSPENSCGPIAAAVLQGQGTRTTVRHGASMTRVVLPYNALSVSPWLRVTIIDHAGRRAWTNPIWRDA